MRCLIWLLIFSFYGHQLRAQDTLRLPRPDLQYFGNCFKDAGALVIAPVKWNKNNYLGFAATISSVAILSSADRSIKDFTQKNRSNFSNSLASYAFMPWGDGRYSIPVMGLFYLYGTLTKDTRSRETACLGMETFFIGGAYTTVWKELIHRYRPYASNSQYTFDGPFRWPNGIFTNATSFPSGHTQSAFSMAAIIACEYHDKTWVPIVAYTLAGLCGLSRIHDNDHWASDVLGGAALGISTGVFIYKREQVRKYNKSLKMKL